MANKNMFLEDYVFKGSQCEKVLALTKKAIDSTSDTKIFSSTIELFIFAALYGCYYNLKSKPEKDNSRTTKIFSSQFNTHNNEVKMVFKYVILLGNSDTIDDVTRLNKTFRNPETDENYTLFEEFMLGGVEDLYNKFILDSNKIYEDYLTILNKILSDINNQNNSDGSIPNNDDFF